VGSDEGSTTGREEGRDFLGCKDSCLDVSCASHSGSDDGWPSRSTRMTFGVRRKRTSGRVGDGRKAQKEATYIYDCLRRASSRFDLYPPGPDCEKGILPYKAT
jgi:hypothetical protein